MEQITIKSSPEFFRETIDETRRTLRAALRSTCGNLAVPDDVKDTMARACGVLGWLYDAVVLNPEGLAETMFRAAPEPIPSERPDCSDLVDADTLFAPEDDAEDGYEWAA